MRQSIFTYITFIKGKAYPIAHTIKMQSGYKLVDSMGRSYGWFKSINDINKFVISK